MKLISDASALMAPLSCWCPATSAARAPDSHTAVITVNSFDEEVFVGELEGISCLRLATATPEKENTACDGSTEAGTLASDAEGDTNLPEEERTEESHRHDEQQCPASPQRSCCAGPSPAPERPDWWSGADLAAHRNLEEAVEITRILDVHVVKHPPATRTSAPWLHGRSDERYEAMGIRNPGEAYVAVWLNLGNVSLLTALEVTDRARLEACLANDPLRRLKVLLHPVRLPLNVPCPTKSARDAESMGAYFGAQYSSCVRGQTANGVDYTCIQVDLHSKMMLRLLLQRFAFREGNVVEFLVVDWEGRSVVSAIRLNVTQEGLRLLC